MKHLVAASALMVLVAAPAMAKDLCNVPKAEWQSKEVLTKKLEGEGWKIKNIKIEDGCYEVYGTDGAGKKQEVFVDPKSFEIVGED